MADFASYSIGHTLYNNTYSMGYDIDNFTSVDPAGVSLKYYMRAWNTALLKHVYWISENTPDFTGSGSGYLPANLADIIVLRF